MRSIKSFVIAGVVGAFTAGSALANPISIGSGGQQTTNYRLAAAIATVASRTSGKDIRVEPHGGASQVIPLVGNGEIHFGVTNVFQVTQALNGTGPFDGRPSKTLRLVGVLHPFLIGYMVRDDSDIRSVGDLKGKAVPTRFKAFKAAHTTTVAMLANAGLELGDITEVPVAGPGQAREDLVRGRVVAATGVVGSGKTAEVDSKIKIRFISLDPDKAAVDRMRTHFPTSYVKEIKPRDGLAGILEPTYVMAYDYAVFASTDTPDEDVYALTKALYEGQSDLAKIQGAFKGFVPARMYRAADVDYHEGAKRFFEEAGLSETSD